MAILTKETPYNLYRTIENFYYYDSINNNVSFKIFNDIFDVFNPEFLNKRITNLFQNNRHYSFHKDIHEINNKYKPEFSQLKVYKSHLILKTDAMEPTLLINYLMSDNLFVCDFKNKDFFWLNEFVR